MIDAKLGPARNILRFDKRHGIHQSLNDHRPYIEVDPYFGYGPNLQDTS